MLNKMQLRLFIFILVYACFAGVAFGQNKTLNIENTLDIVRKYHPVIKQSFLQNEMSKNDLLATKSVFDPSFQMNTEEKTFDNKLYYRFNNS
jgi:hypothetical protein